VLYPVPSQYSHICETQYEKSSIAMTEAALVQEQKHSFGHKSVFYHTGLFNEGSNTCLSLTQIKTRVQAKHNV